ncbi:MAG: hypothetical protein WEG40_05505, partial [Candidatus Rokuibacteriota bacterium]
HVVAATRTAAALALVIAAFVIVHYLWAQGRSSIARDLEAVGAAAEPDGARLKRSVWPAR